MENASKDSNLMFLGSFIDSIDDVREQFGAEYAEFFASCIVYYGVRRIRLNGLIPICQATLESIIPKIEKSAERAKKQRPNPYGRARQPRKKGLKIQLRRQMKLIPFLHKDLYLHFYYHSF